MKQRIVVELRGGTLVAVYASDPAIEVSVVDWDDVADGTVHGNVAFPAQPFDQMPEATRAALGEIGNRIA